MEYFYYPAFSFAKNWFLILLGDYIVQLKFIFFAGQQNLDKFFPPATDSLKYKKLHHFVHRIEVS